jgi:hypothetical protein
MNKLAAENGSSFGACNAGLTSEAEGTEAGATVATREGIAALVVVPGRSAAGALEGQVVLYQGQPIPEKNNEVEGGGESLICVHQTCYSNIQKHARHIVEWETVGHILSGRRQAAL